MARIVSLGSGLQEIYLIDRDDFASTGLGDRSVFGQIDIGANIDIDKVAYEVGGSGVNSAIAFAKHNHESIFLGSLSRDSAGEAIMAVLDEEGVDTSYLNLTRGHTGCSVILLDARSGEHTVLTHHGSTSRNLYLSANDLELIQPDWLYVSSIGGDMELLTKFFKKAKSLDCKIMFNPGVTELRQTKELIKLLGLTDILIVDKREASYIVPGQILTELLSHLKNYVGTVIITVGSMGAIAQHQDEAYRLGIYEDVKVKDSAGAGDAFGAGFLAHFADGHSFYDSLVFASANATSVVTKIGTRAGLLSGNEPLHLMPIQKIS